MSFMSVRFKVEDYEKWKAVFDDDVSARQAAGFKGGYIFRNEDEANELVILLETDNLEKTREFAQSDYLRNKMQESGVIDMPDIKFLDVADRPSV